MICRANDTCGVICIGDGCRDLTLTCELGSICITEPRDCISNAGQLVNGVYCPRNINYNNNNINPMMVNELSNNITRGFANFKATNNIDALDPEMAVFTEIDDNLLIKPTTDDSDDDDSDDNKRSARYYRRRYRRYGKGRRYGNRRYRSYRRFYSKYYW